MTERFAEKYLRLFVEHANSLPISLYGKLLVIGPEKGLVDVLAIEPMLKDVSRLDIVSNEFGTGLEYGLNAILSNSKNATNISNYNVWEYTRFQDLRGAYDSAVFFGAPQSFVKYNHHQEIPKILAQGGTFYGTVNCEANDVSEINDSNCSQKVVRGIKGHPTYNGPWCGLVINKG